MIKVVVNQRLHGIIFDYATVDESLLITIDNDTEKFDLSKLEDDNKYTVTDCLMLPYMPITFILVENGIKLVNLFFDDWYKKEPQKFNRSGVIIEAEPTIKNNLDLAKQHAISQIKGSFKQAFENGHFISNSLGIEVDCRRNGDDNDKQNVEGLISNMTRNSKATVNYTGYSEIKTGVTKTQLEELVAEMEDHVLSLYEKKWMKQLEIQSATTIEEVKAIVW